MGDPLERDSDGALLWFAGKVVAALSELVGLGRVEDLIYRRVSRGTVSVDHGGGIVVAKGADRGSVLGTILSLVVKEFADNFGEEFAEKKLEYVYEELKKKWTDPERAASIFPFIPEPFLEKYRVQFLPVSELQRIVLEKTERLRKINAELEGKVRERTAALEAIVREQDASAKLLVRRDVDLTRANERLRELDEIKSNFISVVAHQLRTPLSGIKWTLNLLMNGDVGPLTREQKALLTKSYESNDRMISLVNDMLGADRVESGKLRYQFAPVALADLVDGVLFEIAPLVAKRRVTVTVLPQNAPVPLVVADPEQIRAVLQNLLENAIKYTMDKGSVRISILPRRGEVEVVIEDTGIGIPKDQQQNVFNRFFRARNAFAVETDGSGLGLYIAKNIVDRHGGKIWFSSEEGKGSAFHFSIPSAPPKT